MAQSKSELFNSFEQFEREYLPRRHASKRAAAAQSVDLIAEEMVATSLVGVAGVLESLSHK